MIKIAICDDNISICSKIEAILDDISKKQGIKMQMDVFISAKEYLPVIENKQKYHIIFLDIHFKEANGVKLAEKIREYDPYAKLIYISYDRSSALQLFDTNPFNFLIKPLTDEKIKSVFKKAMALIVSRQAVHEFQINKMKYRIPLEEILYFENHRRKIKVITFDESYSYYGKMKNLEEELKDKNFHRIHTSYLVNDAHIKVYEYDALELVNGDVLPISQSNRKRIRRIIF